MEEYLTLDHQICGCAWSSAAPERLLARLCYEIGPRPPATDAMKSAQDYLMDELRQMQVDDVWREAVPILAWKPQPCHVTITTPRSREFPAVQHVHSAAGDVTGPLVDVGIPSEQRLAQLGSSLAGSIALLRGFEVAGSKYTPLPLAIARLSRCGVRAAVLQSLYVPGCPAIELAGIDQNPLIPVAGISGSSAQELRQHGPGLTVRMHSAGSAFPAECANVVADLRAPNGTAETVILSAHLDTFYVNPGAFDNLTGVLTLMETVRSLAPLRSQFRRNLRVILFTGEEYGFIGSKAYVAGHSAELDSTVFILNMDSLWPETARGVAVMGSPAMRAYIDGAFREAHRNVDVRDLFCMSSDYLPFVLQGIPAARPADYFNSMPPWSHTTEDTADKIPGDWLRLNAMVFGQLLIRMLTDAAPLPARRLSPDEVRASVAAVDAQRELEAMGFRLR